MASNSACVIASGRGDSRALDEDLVVGDLAEDQEAAVAQHGDPRQRRDGKPLPARPLHPRLEPELLGAAQHLGDADARGAHPMADLVRVGSDAVATQQHHQRP